MSHNIFEIENIDERSAAMTETVNGMSEGFVEAVLAAMDEWLIEVPGTTAYSARTGNTYDPGQFIVQAFLDGLVRCGDFQETYAGNGMSNAKSVESMRMFEYQQRMYEAVADRFAAAHVERWNKAPYSRRGKPGAAKVFNDAEKARWEQDRLNKERAAHGLPPLGSKKEPEAKAEPQQTDVWTTVKGRLRSVKLPTGLKRKAS